MAKKELDKNTVEIRKLITEGKVIIGTERALKALKLGNLSRLYVASNCNSDTVKDIEHYSGINKVEVITLSKTNDDLGIVCKKPFSISVLGITK